MTVRIVTDSTSDIDDETARQLAIAVVPQNVHFGTRSYEDNVTITPDEFYGMLLNASELPTTSQASPGRFKETYDGLGQDADGIVSIHISAKISGTCNSARQAALATSARCPVEVIDSGQASMGLGLIVMAAAELAMQGASQPEIVAAARSAVGRAQCLCLFETLEYLQRGGRIGKAQALMGSLLKIKPMTIVRDGEIHSLGRARTFRRALTELKRAARELAPAESLAVMHSTTPEIASAVAEDLMDMLPQGSQPRIARFGPALGVYAGPGALGIALIQAEDQVQYR